MIILPDIVESWQPRMKVNCRHSYLLEGVIFIRTTVGEEQASSREKKHVYSDDIYASSSTKRGTTFIAINCKNYMS